MVASVMLIDESEEPKGDFVAETDFNVVSYDIAVG